MSSVLQKLISPLAGSPSEPPRNKVTVVGVGQVGMACAVSILLRVRRNGQLILSALFDARNHGNGWCLPHLRTWLTSWLWWM